MPYNRSLPVAAPFRFGAATVRERLHKAQDLAVQALGYCVLQNDDDSWRLTPPIVGQFGKLRWIGHRPGAFSPSKQRRLPPVELPMEARECTGIPSGWGGIA